MSDYITLLGAEQVQSAANTMRSAAEQMGSAAASISWALERHERAMEDFIARFERAAELLAKVSS